MNTGPFDLITHGFLPTQDPILRLPQAFNAWENFAAELPKLLMTHQLQKLLLDLPTFPIAELQTGDEWERAMLILSYIGHAYVWNGYSKPPESLPAHLAVPWYQVAKQLQRPPILSYASYALYNWRRMLTNQPIALGNIVLLQNFLGGADEEWFVLVHVEIEHHAIPVMAAIPKAQQAVVARDASLLQQSLTVMISGLEKMVATLKRMPEHCDPYIYYNRVRPYIHGWKDNPALPHGMIYEGVVDYARKPVFFKGETGAQSTIIPVLDAILGIEHQESPLSAHLREMQQYMPLAHRTFLHTIQQGPCVREMCKQSLSLREAYNACIELIYQFRGMHLHYAAEYIHKQQQHSLSNPTTIGTGGTPFMSYLHKHEKETQTHLLK